LCPSAKAGDAASGGGGSALGDDFEASANVPAALHASLTTAQLAELARRAPDACAIADTFEALATNPSSLSSVASASSRLNASTLLLMPWIRIGLMIRMATETAEKWSYMLRVVEMGATLGADWLSTG